MPKISALPALASGQITAASIFPVVGPNAVTAKVTAQQLGISATPQQFGAKGDGVTDDAVTIQACLTAAPLGSTILFPPLTYLIGTALTVPRGVTIIGFGATLRAKIASGLVQILGAVDVSGITVQGITFDANNTALNGMSFYSTTTSPVGLVVDQCVFQNTPVDVTLNYGGVRTLATGGAGSVNRYRNVTISRCWFQSTIGTIGSMMTYTDHILTTGNFVEGVAGHGLAHVGCTQVVVTDNRLRNVVLDGIEIGAQSTGFEIANNELQNCAVVQDAAISVESCCSHGSVHHNLVYDCKTQGISVSFNSAAASPNDTIRNVQVFGNTIRALAGITTQPGINIYGSTAARANAVKVQDNTIDGFNLGIVLSYAQFSNVSRNAITNLTGALSCAVRVVFCAYTHVEENICDTVTGDHAYQATNQATNACDFIFFRRNTVVTSGVAGAKALCYFEGTGHVIVMDNVTIGSSSFIKCLNVALLQYGQNFGVLTVGEIEGSPTLQGWGKAMVGAFGCNGTLPQGPVASGGVLANVVAALIANGTLSS